jgi:hypothetical protein
MSVTSQSVADVRDAIIRECTKAAKNLGAKSDLLGILCSYGETLTDDEVLEELRHWNSFGPIPRNTARGGNVGLSGRSPCVAV